MGSKGWRIGALLLALVALGAGATALILTLGGGGGSASPTYTTVPVPTTSPDDAGRMPYPYGPPIGEAAAMLRRLVSGTIAFNAPRSLGLGETAEIQLLTSLQWSIKLLKARITEMGAREGYRVRLSDRMVAKLSGLGFQILPLTAEEQWISADAPTEWRWQIEPKETGTLRLHLALSAVIVANGVTSSHTVRTFDRTLTIQVGFGERVTTFMSDNWQWLATVVVLPGVGWLAHRVRKSHRQPSPATRPRGRRQHRRHHPRHA